MTTTASTAIGAPPRLTTALEALGALRGQGLHFVPIRHHSPACSRALSDLLTRVGPARVLIEGPSEFTAMVPALLHPETVPPIAILSASDGIEGRAARTAAFFPLARFSPEWVALREGAARGATVEFIDLSWRSRAALDDGAHSSMPHVDEHDEILTRTLQAERYLAESRSLAALARREHCRDHDDLWDHLFETRGATAGGDVDAFFDDVFSWSALARFDYEPEVLVAEGSVAREAEMLRRIRRARAESDGPLVVVTGAFHTLALVEALTGAEAGALVRSVAEEAGPLSDGLASNAFDGQSGWLVRYDLRRIDALSGYGAGMPSPGFSDRLWGSRDTDSALLDILHAIAARVRDQHTNELVSTPDVLAAATMARRLADLRGHASPARLDVLDAIVSSFGKDSGRGSPALHRAVADVFTGTSMGSIPPGVGAPPLVETTRRRALDLRLVVTDSAPRTISLDLRRKPTHRARSRFLHLLALLDVGFGVRTAGPDPLSRRAPTRVLEEWRYAWTPMVEARLVDLAGGGSSLDGLAVEYLFRREDELDRAGRAGGAAAAVDLLARAALAGLADAVPRLVARSTRSFESDTSLASVVDAAFGVEMLHSARVELGLGDDSGLVALIDRVVPAAAYLSRDLAGTPADEVDGVIGTLLSCRELLLRVDDGFGVDSGPVTREWDRLRESTACAPGIRGALSALAAIDDRISADELAELISARISPGADADSSVRFVAGVIRAAPELILRDPVILEAIHGRITTLDEAAFLAFLPDLRRAFARLRPTETARLAQSVAALTGTSAAQIAGVRLDIATADVADASDRQRALSRLLSGGGLGAWAGGARV